MQTFAADTAAVVENHVADQLILCRLFCRADGGSLFKAIGARASISLAAPCFSLLFDPAESGAPAAKPFVVAAATCVLGLAVLVREVGMLTPERTPLESAAACAPGRAAYDRAPVVEA